MSDAKVLAGPAGPYVAAVQLRIGNTRGEPTAEVDAGDVVELDEGDICDVESLLAIGALKEPAERTDEAIAALRDEAKADDERRQARRSRRGTETLGG